MKGLFVVLIVLLVLVQVGSSQQSSFSTNNGCSFDNACSMRSYLSDLKSEVHDLSCIETKLEKTISLLNNFSSEGVSQIKEIRMKQLQKIHTSKIRLETEISVLSLQCSENMGMDCNVKCESGWTGVECNIPKCFGVAANNASVCSGRGNCTTVDKCECNLEFNSTNCNSSSVIGLTSDSSPRKYLDGSYATSCNAYLKPQYPYVYHNEGDGVYNIKPGSNVLTVYCDMTTDGGGWTLISGIRYDYRGVHFHTFEKSSAVISSSTQNFHIDTEDLLKVSTQIRAAHDSSTTTINSFYSSSWVCSVACDINDALRTAITKPTLNNGDILATCHIINGIPESKKPTHYTYGRTQSGHSTGFRVGKQDLSDSGSLIRPGFATFSYADAPEGYHGYQPTGVFYTFIDGINSRNGVLFLK